MNVTHVLERIKENYLHFTNVGTRFSIADLLPGESQRMLSYCQKFKPHAESNSLISLTKQFCEEHGIWLKKSIYHLSCDPFLYPYAESGRLLIMMKHLAMDFFLNDKMGRDIFKSLNSEEQETAVELIGRIALLDQKLNILPNAHFIEQINIDLLKMMQELSPADWFNRFLELYVHHVEITHRDNGVSSLGYIPTVTEYSENRLHTSGMIFMMMRIEFADGNFLDWEWLEKIGIAKYLRRLHQVVAEFGGLSNDIFSFEKEVIDNSSDANLIMVLALNDLIPNLEQSLKQAGLMLKALVSEYFNLLERIRAIIETICPKESIKAGSLSKHLDGVEIVFKACLLWQLHTERYKRQNSIFLETELVLDHKLTA
ncbi:hypothetical protein GO495_06535 [Chitinophaga oryziterrae]|uniref:Terpene synthase n=1 Tax=Chitinophaga oryziterrae TaxID=1031224 RepID=A0A6N8J6H4_9BACT|nr:terpene synthase family protein [Chitinophaga oryziterrae]MVT40231.1 hypothetical protein [Chitinophaga oryziterrae]